MGARKNGRKRGRHARRVSFSSARSFLGPLLLSACYAGYFMKYAQILSTQGSPLAPPSLPFQHFFKLKKKFGQTCYASRNRTAPDMETNEASTQRNEYSKLDKTRRETKNTIVIRGDWLWKATTIKLNIKTQCRLCWKLREGSKSFVFCWQIVTE